MVWIYVTKLGKYELLCKTGHLNLYPLTFHPQFSLVKIELKIELLCNFAVVLIVVILFNPYPFTLNLI